MSIIRRKGCNNLYMKFKFKRKQYLLSCRTADREYAERKEREFRSRLEKEDYLSSLAPPAAEERLTRVLETIIKQQVETNRQIQKLIKRLGER